MTDPVTNPPAETKPWWTSRTIWVNLLSLIAAVLTSMGMTSVLGFDLSPEGQATIIATVTPIANIILRLVTRTAIG